VVHRGSLGRHSSLQNLLVQAYPSYIWESSSSENNNNNDKQQPISTHHHLPLNEQERMWHIIEKIGQQQAKKEERQKQEEEKREINDDGGDNDDNANEDDIDDKLFEDLHPLSLPYAKFLAKVLNYKTVNDWYNISKKDFLDNEGGRILSAYGKSPRLFVMSVFPEHDWQSWRFGTRPKFWWWEKENVKCFVRDVEEKLKIDVGDGKDGVKGWLRVSA